MIASAAAPAATQAIPLSKGNQVVDDALAASREALRLLNDQGIGVIDGIIRGGRAVLRIDRPPVGVEGVAAVTRSDGMLREQVWAAPFHNCQLEWRGVLASPRTVTSIGGRSHDHRV